MARRSRSFFAAVALATGAVATAAPLESARAQSRDDVASAEAAFNAGKALLEGGQYADACSKFAESKRLAPGLGVTLYLADCYEHIGRTASAWAEFRTAEGLARARGDARADVARARAQGLEPKLHRLTFVVAPTVPRTGLRVLLDGAAFASEEWGLARAVDPGDHVVVVISPDHPSRTLIAHLGPDAQTATLRLDSLDEPSAPGQRSASPPPAPTPTPTPTPTPAAGPTPSPANAPPESAPQTSSDSGGTLRILGIGTGVVGVIGIGIGAVTGLVAKSKLDQSNQTGNCDATDHCSPGGLALRSQAGSNATASTVLFTVGGVALAAGAAMFLLAPHGSSTASTAWVLAPVPLVNGAGATLHGTF